MNDCLTCKYSRIDGIWGDMDCKLKNHICERLNDVEFVGKTISGDDDTVDCKDGVRVG